MRLIDADEIVKVAEHAYNEWNLAMVGAETNREVNLVYKRQELCKAIKAVADSMPTIDAAPVVHGRWIKKQVLRGGIRQYTGVDAMGETHTITVDERMVYDDLYCSECNGRSADSWLDFCPHCGAKMDLEATNENH